MAYCLKIHAVIPARGGSKGLPGKNIVDFCGRPLVAWSISCARESTAIERVWVTTDDPCIAEVAHSYGAGVINRPAEISGDAATSESALIHAVGVINSAGEPPTHLMFLQATSPLREPAELDGAARTLSKQQLDSLFSAAPAGDFCLWKRTGNALESMSFDYRARGRRQDNEDESIWIETGSFYLTEIRGLLQSGNRLHGHIGLYEVESWKVFEIDDAAGLLLCQSLFTEKLLQTTQPPEYHADH